MKRVQRWLLDHMRGFDALIQDMSFVCVCSEKKYCKKNFYCVTYLRQLFRDSNTSDNAQLISTNKLSKES